MKRVNYMAMGLTALSLAGMILPVTNVLAAGEADTPSKKTSRWFEGYFIIGKSSGSEV